MHIRYPNASTLLVIALLSIGLTGCGGGGGSAAGIPIPADPTVASQDDLESLFDQISLQLSSAKVGSDLAVALQDKRSIVGGELAKRASAAIRTRLSEIERIDDQLPLGALERELGGLSATKRWDVGVHAEISAELSDELSTTRRVIKERENRLSSTSEREILERINLLSNLSALSGTGSVRQARYAQQRDEILHNVSKEAEEAILAEDYEKAQNLLGIVQEVNPQDEGTRRAKCEVDGKVIVKRFNDALETGRISQTIERLTEFSETDCFRDIKD